MIETANFLTRPEKPSLAYRQLKGKGPGLLWLGGYASDMLGTKAAFLHEWAQAQKRSFTRFDYSGHGQSGGNFEDGCISTWCDDAIAIVEELTEGPQILIGSSMGAWIACLLARKLPQRLAGILFIAPAPDFTTKLIPQEWPQDYFDRLEQDGKIVLPSSYDDSTMTYTQKLFEDGKNCSVLDQPLSVSCPVTILQGMKDEAVPWHHAMKLAEHINAPQVQIIIEKNSDHRFSGPRELTLIASALQALSN